jgi:hypothetical protein
LKQQDYPHFKNGLLALGTSFLFWEFEHCGRLWISLVKKFGGVHHGYFLPSEGADNIALALFNFPSLAAYEEYRTESFF